MNILGIEIEDKALLSVNDVCDLLSCSRPTVYKLISSGSLPTVMVGSRKRIPATALLAYLNGKEK